MTTQEIHEFVTSELGRFDPEERHPFRVAVSANHNGGDYAYGSHTEQRGYADTTVGYAHDQTEARRLLYEAAYEAERRNLLHSHSREMEAIDTELEEVLAAIA